MIQAKFGLPGLALRTLEIYTSATLEATLTPPAPARRRVARADGGAGRHARARRTGRWCTTSRGFIPYFRAATPEQEFEELTIGSRPARRRTGGGVESLRAIPWVFAWTQTRLLLPSWLGVGEALGAAIERGELEELRRMYRDWPFFRSTLDLIEMVLAKADARIAAHYERQLVPPDLAGFGADLRRRLDDTARHVLAVTGRERLLADNPVLRRSIDVRNPYVDPDQPGAGRAAAPPAARRRRRAPAPRVPDHRQRHRRGHAEHRVDSSGCRQLQPQAFGPEAIGPQSAV